MTRRISNRNKYQSLFLITALCLMLSAVVLGADEATAVDRSSLLGVRLPARALRVNDGHVPNEIRQSMQKLVAEAGGKLRQGNSEVLVWTGSELKKSGTTGIVTRLTATLKAEGWQYDVGGMENGITFFSLLKDGAEPRAVIGFFGEAEETFIFAMTEIHASENKRAETPVAAPTGELPDYSFTTPTGWSRRDSGGRIVLTKDDDKAIAFLPLLDSSGDLERDAERIIWQAFKGSAAWSGNGFEDDWGTFEKGKTMQGLEYFRVYRYAKNAGDNNAFPASRFDAVLLLVKLGSKVAVIAGRAPFQSDYARDSTISAIDLILYDLSFKNAPNSYNVKSDLLGSWSAATTTVAVAYTFNQNGTFHKGGVHEIRTSRDSRTDNVTTTSYGTTDAYSIAGNVLTQNYKRTGQVMKYKVRVYQTKYNKDAWQEKVGFLPTENPEGGTMVMRRSN
jgi:hypothetical protein